MRRFIVIVCCLVFVVLLFWLATNVLDAATWFKPDPAQPPPAYPRALSEKLLAEGELPTKIEYFDAYSAMRFETTDRLEAVVKYYADVFSEQGWQGGLGRSDNEKLFFNYVSDKGLHPVYWRSVVLVSSTNGILTFDVVSGGNGGG